MVIIRFVRATGKNAAEFRVAQNRKANDAIVLCIGSRFAGELR